MFVAGLLMTRAEKHTDVSITIRDERALYGMGSIVDDRQ